jgi:pimeloyl-ACP methyl ester carboxylesterase
MAVVLIPGFMLDRALWSDIESRLIHAGPLIHADTSVGNSIEEIAQQTLRHAPARFSLIGFSMGGYIAREIARIAPERVSRLVLIATSSRGDTEQQTLRKLEAVSADPSTFAGVSRKSIRQSLAPQREHDSALIEHIQAMSVRLGGETFHRQALMRREGDTRRLAEIGCPTLIIAGAHDRLRHMEEARELHMGIPDSQLAVLDAGHMIPLEAPDALADILQDFL